MSRLLVLANEATAAQRRVYFHLVDATDGITAETTEAGGQPQVSSDGGAWTNTGISTLTAIGNGRYYADLTQTLVQTAGTLIETRYKSANTAECPGDSVQVVAFDPNSATDLGLSSIADILTDTGTTLQAELDGIQATIGVAGAGLTAVPGAYPITSGTAQDGSASTITLAASTSYADSILVGNRVRIVSGTGAGQTRFISAWTNVNDQAGVTPNWTTTPDATSVYEVLPGAGVNQVNVLYWNSEAVESSSIAGRPNVQIAGANASVITATAIATNAITAAKIADGAIDAATFAADVDAEARSWLGLASANLDTQLADLPTVAEFEARTLVAANYFDPAADTVANVTNVSVLTTYTGNTVQTGDAYAALTSAVPDSVPADGSRPSVQQAVRMILQAMIEGAIASTTWTVKKEDGSTTLFTVTLDSATTPTSKTRAT
jgi:hypothetical protein